MKRSEAPSPCVKFVFLSYRDRVGDNNVGILRTKNPKDEKI